jgi:hypothetical protein
MRHAYKLNWYIVPTQKPLIRVQVLFACRQFMMKFEAEIATFFLLRFFISKFQAKPEATEQL